MTLPEADDPLFRPITIEAAMARTGRSRRTIDRWISSGNLRVVRLAYPDEVVLVEREVLEMERAARAARKRGRPPKQPRCDSPS